jgi:hypothetical protein
LFYRKPRGQIPQQEYVSPQKIIPQLKMNVYTTLTTIQLYITRTMLNGIYVQYR